MSEVISFAAFQRQRTEFAPPPGWTNSERAELYRVEAILHQSGIVIETEEGVSDEGDPWFAFCRADGEVLIHIARADGQYGFHSPALTHPLRGRSFSELCAVFQELFPLRVAVREKEPTNVLLHPAAILSLVVGTIFLSFDEMLSTRAEAATLNAGQPVAPAMSEEPAASLTMPHDISVSESAKAVEQFQTLAAKNFKAVLAGRVEGAQNPAYAALTTSLLIFAAGSLDAATQNAFAEEAKIDPHHVAEFSQRHDEAAGLSFDVGVAREPDHPGSRIAPNTEEARIVSGHMVFGESVSGKLQAETSAAPSEQHVDNANASIQFDFSQTLKLNAAGHHPPSIHDLGSPHADWRVSLWQASSAHPAEGTSGQTIDPLGHDETNKVQTQSVGASQSAEPSQASGTQSRTSSLHDASATARVDTVEVLLASLPDQLSSNLHFSNEPVKFMLEEWDKIDFGKEPASKEAAKPTGEASPPPSDPTVDTIPDTGHANDLSEKLNAVELALYDKVLGYQAGGNLSHFDLEAKSQILKFVEKAADIDIIVSDHVIMFVDEAVHASAGATPYMKIWETGDGEAISIVGLTDPSHPTFA